MVRVVWKVALVLVPGLLLILLLVPRGQHMSGGHLDERLDVTVRVVDGETGRPLSGAVVTVARYRSNPFRGDAGQATDEPVTAVVSSVHVTRWQNEGIVTRKEVTLPEVLLIDHPERGQAIVPIDPKTPLTEGDEPNTWRLDLGTVSIPR